MGLLGPSRDEILQTIAINTNGEFKKGKMFKTSCIKYTHESWCYYLDDYSIQAGNVPIIYTRLRAPFINKKGFDLTIYKKTIFSNIAKTLVDMILLQAILILMKNGLLRVVVKNLLKVY